MKSAFLLLLVLISIYACNNNGVVNEKSEKNYEKAKESLAAVEQKNPSKFLVVEGDKKKNLIGQTVVKGKITNTAKMVSFKDIHIKLQFYSKTSTLLEEDVETVYDVVNPGQTISFKTKYYTPKGTDSLALIVIDAKH